MRQGPFGAPVRHDVYDACKHVRGRSALRAEYRLICRCAAEPARTKHEHGGIPKTGVRVTNSPLLSSSQSPPWNAHPPELLHKRAHSTVPFLCYLAPCLAAYSAQRLRHAEGDRGGGGVGCQQRFGRGRTYSASPHPPISVQISSLYDGDTVTTRSAIIIPPVREFPGSETRHERYALKPVVAKDRVREEGGGGVSGRCIVGRFTK